MKGWGVRGVRHKIRVVDWWEWDHTVHTPLYSLRVEILVRCLILLLLSFFPFIYLFLFYIYIKKSSVFFVFVVFFQIYIYKIKKIRRWPLEYLSFELCYYIGFYWYNFLYLCCYISSVLICLINQICIVIFVFNS
jgi:hypothetical protein